MGHKVMQKHMNFRKISKEEGIVDGIWERCTFMWIDSNDNALYKYVIVKE